MSLDVIQAFNAAQICFLGPRLLPKLLFHVLKLRVLRRSKKLHVIPRPLDVFFDFNPQGLVLEVAVPVAFDLVVERVVYNFAVVQKAKLSLRVIFSHHRIN
jgi:hypothetical protein